MPISGSIGQGNHGSENQAQIICRSAGTFSNLTVHSTSNTPTVVFRVNGATGNQTISSSGQATDSVNTDAVISGDKVDLDLSSGSSVVLQSLSSYFTATTTSNTVTRLNSTGDNSGITQSNENYFFVPGGRCVSGGTSTEVNAQIIQQKSGTMKHLFAFVNGNSRGETDTLNDRNNGANGNLTQTIGSNATGTFEDSANSTTVVSGDKYCVDIVLGGSSSSMSLNQIGIDFITTSSATEMVVGISNGISMSSGSTQEWPLGGELQSNTTESNRQIAIQVAYTFSNMSINLIVNTSARTMTFRDGGANGNETFTTTTGTGFFSDSTNTDVALVGDLVNYQYGTGSAAATVVAASIWGATASAAVANARQMTIKSNPPFLTDMHFTSTVFKDTIGS